MSSDSYSVVEKAKEPVGASSTVMSSSDLQPAPVTLVRNISIISIIGLGFSICNGWAAMSSTIVIGLSQGGTVVILYGLMFVTLINIFLALSLGELAAAYPSAGGQYVWSAILAKTPATRRGISFVVGWCTVFEWLTIVASVVIITAEVIFSIVQLYHPDFVIQRWQVFLVYLAVNFGSVLYNIFLAQRTSWIGKAFLYFSSLIFLVILVTTVASAPTYQSNEFVWRTYTNEIGWSSSFIVVSTGLVNPAYIWAGLNGAVHIAEDCINPAKAVPLALMSTVGIGFITGFAMSVGLMYCIQDLSAALDSELPFLTIIVQATGSKACGVVLMVAFILCLLVSTNSVHQATGRLIWSFARDDALPFSKQLKAVHPTLRVPVIPLLISGAGVTVLGALYVASTTAYGSIIETCIILGNISFSVPAFQLLLNGRKMNPNRWLKLGPLGAVANVVTILWTLLTTVMWLFPLVPNPAPIEMNYGCAVLGGMTLIAGIDWIFVGRKYFEGPTDEKLRELLREEEVANGGGMTEVI